MSAGETVTVITPPLGRIQCAPGYTTSEVYVTIVNNVDQPYSKPPQPENQSFCMVRTPSMGNYCLLVDYPNLRNVMMCTRIKSPIGGTKLLIEPVTTTGEPLVNGGKLPRDFGKDYRFRLERVESKWHIYCESVDIAGPSTLIQTGYGNTHGGKENEPIVIDKFSNVPWEFISFENPPKRT